MARAKDAKLPIGLRLIAWAGSLVLVGVLWLLLHATVLAWVDQALQPARSAGRLCFFDNTSTKAEALMNQAGQESAAGNEAKALALAVEGDIVIEKAADRRDWMLPYRDITWPGWVPTSQNTISLLRSKIKAYRNRCFRLSIFR